ncbi:MAG: polymorphic outer membrane protein [Solirubrobacteraceae bacterium]|nr:polymorphic outer membrane protein [Solirubrobacteraceae bacterium]
MSPRSLVPALLVCALLAVPSSASAAAQTFTVNTTADTMDAGGCVSDPACSLRDAVAAANTTGNSGSTIVLPAGTFPITADEIVISQDVTIDGAGTRGTVLDASTGPGTRIFRLDDSADPTVTLSDMTLTGGTAPGAGGVTPLDGGAILAGGDLTLRRVDVRGNTAEQGGGAIATPGIEGLTNWAVTLVDSTVSGNQVTGGAGNGQGGGLAVTGDLTMTNSTVSGNTIANPGTEEGGGVWVTNGSAGTSTLTLDNSVIAGNTMATGPFGAGLYATSVTTETVRNTIIAGNTVAGGAELDCSPFATPTTVNDIGGDSTCLFSDAGSKQGVDPKLGAVADNGGPVDTQLPDPSSPAVDAGDPATCTAADARGIARPQGASCDIGAVELFPPTATTGPVTGVTPSAATLSGTAGTSPVSPATASFDYGTTTGYGQSTAPQDVAAGATATAVGAGLTGLSPSTTYHVRLVVHSREGTATGADQTFTTAAVPPPPPTPPPAPTPAPTPAPKPAPVISKLAVLHRCIRAATLTPSPRPGTSGLSFTYRLSEDATVRFAILRRVNSPHWRACPKRGGTTPITFKPLTPETTHGSKGAQTTTLAKGTARRGGTARAASAKRSTLRLTHTAALRRLPAGTYLLQLTATTADGRTSRPVSIKFWVYAPRHPKH